MWPLYSTPAAGIAIPTLPTPTSAARRPPASPFIESLNNRGTEGVVNGLKPYRQHESVLGYDYQINPTLALRPVGTVADWIA